MREEFASWELARAHAKFLAEELDMLAFEFRDPPEDLVYAAVKAAEILDFIDLEIKAR